MKIISIGTDRNLFDKESVVRARILEYGALFEEMHIVVFTKLSSKYKPEKISPNMWIYPTNSFSRFLYVRDATKTAFDIYKKINQNLNNIIVTCEDPFGCGLVGMRLKKKTNIALHIQIHTDFLSPFFKKESFFNMFRVRIAKKVLPFADAVRVVSERIKTSLLKTNLIHVDPKVLPIFVDIEKIKQTPITFDLKKKYPQFKFIVLVASRLTKEKNISLALKALGCIITQYPGVGLVIAGSGREEFSLKKEVRNLGLSKNVMFESWQQDLISYYKTAHLFLVTSNYEGYGMTIVEALASHCPTIATDVGIARDVLSDGDVFVCPVGDDYCLYEKIKLCIENNALRETFAEEAMLRLAKVTFQSKSVYLEEYKTSINSANDFLVKK